MEYNIKFKLGLEGIGDFSTEFLTEEETKNLFEELKQRREKIEQEGLLGKEYTISVKIMENPLLDLKAEPLSITSHEIKIIDLSNETP